MKKPNAMLMVITLSSTFFFAVVLVSSLIHQSQVDLFTLGLLVYVLFMFVMSTIAGMQYLRSGYGRLNTNISDLIIGQIYRVITNDPQTNEGSYAVIVAAELPDGTLGERYGFAFSERPPARFVVTVDHEMSPLDDRRAYKGDQAEKPT